MTRSPLPLLVALCAVTAGPTAVAQVGGTKMSPGLWEHSFTMKTQSGQMEKAMKEMQQAMAGMPPEQRRQMEAMMAQRGMSMGPQGNSVKVCLTKEEAERDEPPPAQDGCTQTARRSGNVWSISFKCPGPPPSSGDGRVTLHSATAYSGVIDAVTEVEGQPEKVQMTTSGKWLGANCGNIKPRKP
jgi:hypothetical protein